MASVRIGSGAGAGAFEALRGALARTGFLRFAIVPGLGFGLGFAAGLAGIFMPAMLWPAAMPDSIATAAAATNHLILIIGNLRGMG